jgi:hypothetical protein
VTRFQQLSISQEFSPGYDPVFIYKKRGMGNQRMNIAQSENESIVVAKTCGCKSAGGKVTYAFVD